MKLYRSFLIFLVFNLLHIHMNAQIAPKETLTFAQSLHALFPEAAISKMAAKDHFVESYQLVIDQLLDHQDPGAGTFQHFVYLSHVQFDAPVVLVTEGYDAWPRTYELSKLFKANQVQVEYRFYGKSKPEIMDWKYLKNDQAIEDYHQLVNKLKSLYTGKWISTGISKGGETVLIYKSKYPEDVAVAIPYVAPLIKGQEDQRTEAHIKSVGSEVCRNKIIKFQRQVLKNRDSVLLEINKYAVKKKMGFTELSLEEALEYSVLEFPFSFWQWGGQCDEIPKETASAKELFYYLNKIVGISFYNDETYDALLPSYYQHMVELGYYGFDTKPVKDLLKVVKQPTNLRFAPKDTDLTYDENYIKKVRDFVENKGDKILYIYGEYDTWGACAPSPNPNVDALKMVLKEGSHKTRISDFSIEDQQKIYRKLQAWLGAGVKLYPLENK